MIDKDILRLAHENVVNAINELSEVYNNTIDAMYEENEDLADEVEQFARDAAQVLADIDEEMQGMNQKIAAASSE